MTTPLFWPDWLKLRLPYSLRWEAVFDNKDVFIEGLLRSLELAAIGLAIGTVIGLICAFLRSSGYRPLAWLITAYVELVRNVPLLLLVFMFQFGLPQVFPRGSTERDFILDVLPTSYRTFAVALSIYAGAYLTEIFGAGILSVSRRYLDAGRSIGLQRFALARYVTGPIMFRTVLPSLSNTFISLFKDTGIAFFIGVRELSFAASYINTEYFRPIEGWVAAGVLYLITAWLLAFSLRFLESRIRWTV